MNKALLEARKKFRGQQAKIEGFSGFDNSPLPEGIYVAQITESKIKERDIKGITRPVHYLMLKVADGDNKGRNIWPYSPTLDEADGIISMARNVMAIKGDGSVPGYKDSDGNFNLAMDAFLEEAESYASALVGEMVEVKCMNRKPTASGSHLNPETGQPYQNFFIQRGLGDDAASYNEGSTSTDTTQTRKAGQSMSVGSKKKATKKKVAKKKVAKKKVVKRKK